MQSVPLLVLLLGLADGPALATDLKPVRVGKPVENSQVPPILAQGRFLASQGVSALAVSGDGRRIAVTTMAFRHDRNFWLLSGEGKILWGRSVLPWAPYQVAATTGGEAFAVGLAYSRITPPYPTT